MFDDFSGFEEDGSRPTQVRKPSFLDNLKFGAQGDAREAGERGMPGSFGEYLGRILRDQRGPAAPQRPMPMMGQPQPQRPGAGGLTQKKGLWSNLIGMLGK